MKKTLLAILFGVVLTLTGTPHGALAQTPLAYTSDRIGVTFPVQLGALRLFKVTDFEAQQRGLGTGIAYRSDNPFIGVDVFIYTLNTTVPNGHESGVIKAQIEQAIGDVHAMVAHGRYADVQVRNPPAPCRVGAILFQCAELSYTTISPQGRGQALSRVMVRGSKGHFIKLRMTWAEQADARTRPLVEQFLTSLGALLPTN